MQQLYYGFSKSLHAFQPKGEVRTLNEFDFDAHIKFLEVFMTELANAMMFCKQFAELPLGDKVNISFVSKSQPLVKSKKFNCAKFL